jgi:hypothetical protein
MKRFFLIIFITVSVLSFAQEATVSSEKIKKEKKISYSLINEYGFYIGGDIEGDYVYGEMVGVLINGIRFNKTQNEIGIGIGFQYFFVTGGIPVFLNYRHYFQSETKYKPLINIALGTRLSTVEVNHEPPFETRRQAGLYSTFAGGFRYKALSFTAGLLLLNGDIRERGILCGLEIKTGVTF